jgi:transposase
MKAARNPGRFTEAANTGIKQIKRTGRGYRNAGIYRSRILLASAARTAA